MKNCPTCFEGKEDFELSEVKRKDLINDFDDNKYVVLDKVRILSLKNVEVIELSKILLSIANVTRNGKVIANRAYWKHDLKRSRS